MVARFDSNLKGLNTIWVQSVGKLIHMTDEDVKDVIIDMERTGWL